MKKLLLTIIMAVFVASSIFAQGTKVASAYQYLRDEQPEKAKVEIDAACLHQSTKDEAKTWFYRGNTYLQLYLGAHMTDNLNKGLSTDEVKSILGDPSIIRRYKKLENGEKFSYLYELVVYFANDSVDHWDFPMEQTFKELDDGNLLQVAYDSYIKALELDDNFKKPELSPGTPQQGILNIGKLYSFYGSTALRADDFKTALESYEKAMPIYKGTGEDEELAIIYYSAGFSAHFLGDTAKAIEYYQKSISPNMKNRNIYINLAMLYLSTNQIDKALDVTQKGRKVLPDDQDLLITEANIYMHDGRSADANKLLSEAAKKDPDNSQLQYAIGINYDKMYRDTTISEDMKESSFDACVASYKRAVEIDPNYFNAAFNLGAMYYNKGADILKYIGNLPYSETEKYNKGKSEAKTSFTNSIPYLEIAHKIDAKDRSTMIMLRVAYTQVGDVEGFKRIKAELAQ